MEITPYHTIIQHSLQHQDTLSISFLDNMFYIHIDNPWADTSNDSFGVEASLSFDSREGLLLVKWMLEMVTSHGS